MAAFMKTPSGIFTRSPMDLESRDTADPTYSIHPKAAGEKRRSLAA